MTTYIVTFGEYSDYGIQGVFSTREKAAAFAVQLKSASYDADIEEWTTDERAAEVYGPIFRVRLSLKDGSSPCGPWSYERVRRPDDSGHQYLNGTYVDGWSAESFERALKIAAEARQAYLRERSQ